MRECPMRSCLPLILLAACTSAPVERWDSSLPDAVSGADESVLPLTVLVGDERSRNVHPWVQEGWLYYASDRGGAGFDIYRQRLGTPAAEQLTSAQGDELWPRLSPDGTRVVYSARPSGRWQIFILDLASRLSSPVTLAVNECVQPAWSSNGHSVAYSMYSDMHGQWLLHMVELDAHGVAARLTLQTAEGKPVAGMHPCLAGESLRFQSAPRGDAGWYEIKSFDLARGSLTSLGPVRVWGAIQPAPWGDGLVAVTVAKASRDPLRGDGFVLLDPFGRTLADLRAPGGLTEVASPMYADGKLYFSARHGQAEWIWCFPLEPYETKPPQQPSTLQAR